MQESDIIVCDPGRHYRVGPRVTRLGLLVTDSVEVRRIASPHMRALAERTGEDAYLAVRIGDSVVYASKYGGIQPVKVDVRLGEPRPLHSTSVGKLFLAFDSKLQDKVLKDGRLTAFTPYTITDRRTLLRELETIRRTRLSISREEAIVGVIAIAKPVWDRTGTIAAAVSVSALRARVPRTRIGKIVKEVQRAAFGITRELRGRDAIESSLDSRRERVAGSPVLVR